MRALVTGGGGFLGQAICRQLRERGDDVRSLARGDYPELASLGVEAIRGDITDRAAVAHAMAGCDVVFHVAAKAGVWGPAAEYEQINLHGTRNVLAGCREAGIRKLVYTSSPSVVHAGGDQEGIDESAPYPASFATHYPRTKAAAEQEVIAANGPDLATVSLRPHLIWGPGDNHLVPRLIDRARSGRLRRVGPGTNRVDVVYIDNAAEAHLLAADRLSPGSPVAGKSYFISQGEPVNLWDFVNQILACADLPPLTKSVSLGTAKTIGGVLEAVYSLLGRRDEPPMTRFVAEQLGTSHWYDISAARRDLGYQPRVSTEEGLERMREWLHGRGVGPTS
jgi:nucleoside-diphosphate-sugar epimerase